MTGQDLETNAGQLRQAFEQQDTALLFTLLDADVRWGTYGDRACRNRAQVVTWYGNLFARGMRATIVGTAFEPDAVVLTFAITQQIEDNPRAPQVRQRFALAGGKVVEIREADADS